MDKKGKIVPIVRGRGSKGKWNLYNQINDEIGELDKVLGFERDENGVSLSRLASEGNEFAKRKMEQLRRLYPGALERQIHLTAMAIKLEDELGITDEYMRILESLDFSDEDLEAPVRET